MLIRAAKPEDTLQLAEAHVQSWRTTYIGQVPQSYLDELSVPKRQATWSESLTNPGHNIFIAEDRGKILGFTSFGPSRDDDALPSTGELYAIYLTEENKGLGIGRDLWAQTYQTLKELCFAEVTLWVLSTNQRALNFYNKAGFVFDNKEKLVAIGGKELKELRYRRKIC